MAKASKRLGNATLVKYGYGQVEPNHLSAPYNGEVYAQLPADKDIEILENGQFVKYNMAKGVCNFDIDAVSGAWFMVYNEVKIYRDREGDADFAMIKDNYNARVYSAVGQDTAALRQVLDYTGAATREGSNTPYKKEIETLNRIALMPEGTTMVPRVIKISVGDWWTTNTINADLADLKAGETMLKIGATGILEPTTTATAGGDTDPLFVVVKVYTMPDLQPGVKVQRVK